MGMTYTENWEGQVPKQEVGGIAGKWGKER